MASHRPQGRAAQAPAPTPSDDKTAPQQDAESAPSTDPPTDLEIVERGLRAEGASSEAVAEVEAARAALRRLEAELLERAARQKGELAKSRRRLRVLASRSYSAPGAGIFRPPAGAVYRRDSEAQLFNAIAAQGRLGLDFEFLPEK